MRNRKIIINIRETATISEIDALIHWLETPVPRSKADNVIESVNLKLGGTDTEIRRK